MDHVGKYNTIVVGGDRSVMQDLLLTGLDKGTKIFILDVGENFQKMCDSVKGQQIQFSKTSQICLNPFTHISLTDADERAASFSFLKSVISCMAVSTEATSDLENAIIETAIRVVWENKKNDATITDVALWLKNQPETKVKILGKMLAPYTKGGLYAKHFEGKNNVKFNNALILIQFEELKLKKDLQAVLFQLFIMLIMTQALLGDKKTPFYICINKASDLLRGKQSGPFIEMLAKRLRKYNGSLVIGTQGIEEFFEAPGALAAFQNNDWMCLLAQKNTLTKAFAESKKTVVRRREM